MGFIPARYAGSDDVSDDAVRLGRKTDWIEQGGGFAVPVGQRLFATNEAEYPMLEVRALTMGAPIVPKTDREGAVHG